MIGRAQGNDILLPPGFVSAHHARIEPVGQTHQIIDVGSTNGLLFEGKRLAPNTPLLLTDGAVLRIGESTTGSYITLTYRNPQTMASQAAVHPRRSHKLNPQQGQMRLGREQSDIVLDNPQVSRHHALIEREGTHHLLSDIGSTNGTFVNGQRISRHKLQPGDVIQIGAFRLVYNGTSLDEFDQRGSLRIDARQLTRGVGSRGQTRLILKNVSLSIAPREFVALVGGSGTGKSTLLNALSGNTQPSAGQVLVNGDDFYRNFDAYRAVLGYVPQDDILHRQLTVEHALHYAARLRLPADTDQTEITRRITQVLDDVEMGAHRHKVVENLSGGQRKRVSIAAELLADPSLFFLDEPTSGLDPGLEKKMMYTLRRLADGGRTIVLVTHATANIAQCDHVVFMADGHLVYFGPPEEALLFFQVSSGDFADIYTKLDGQADPNDPDRWAIVQQNLQNEYTAWKAMQPAGGQRGHKSQPTAIPTLAALWEQRFRASPQYTRYVVGRLGNAPAPNTSGPTPQRQARISPLRQFGILTRRYSELLTRDRRNLLILLLQAPLISALLAVVSKSNVLISPSESIMSTLTTLCMLATVAVWFGIINAAREIAKEEPIYRRERLANLRIGPYVLSKVLVLFVLVLIQSAMLLGILALKVQFPMDIAIILPPWIELYITTVLTSLAGLAAGLAISSFASTPDRAISLVPLALIPQILLAGVIFPLETDDSIQSRLSWLTISRWSMDAYGSTIIGDRVDLSRYGDYSPSTANLLLCWGKLLLMMLVYLGIAGWMLKRRDRRV
ncbi:MAG: FHA domain-containing protein [Roseiflexaceae bacterium]